MIIMGCICTKSLYRTSPSECRHHPRIVSTTERNPPEVTKPKEAVEGRNQVPYPSLKSRLVFSSSILHPLHPFFDLNLTVVSEAPHSISQGGNERAAFHEM